MKNEYPERFFPLYGNHEGFKIMNYKHPDFWNSLTESESDYYHNNFF